MRLANCINDLVLRSQSAFIKKMSIHDNLTFIKKRNIVKELHKAKFPALFVKLDMNCHACLRAIMAGRDCRSGGHHARMPPH